MSKRIVLFADAEVGLKIIQYLINNFIEDLLHIVVTSEESKIFKAASSNGIDCSVFESTEYNLVR